MKKIVVLGAGMVGSAIAADLSRSCDVTVVDLSEKRLERLRVKYGVEVRAADLSEPEAVQGAVANCDLAVGAVPGFLGFETLRSVIEAGRNVVDISFFNEDPFLLDELAKEKGVTAVVDCGVAPGMSNILLGHHDRTMQVESFDCYVGGLPVRRSWPFQYKAPFSPIDVVEEYTRPARLVENGEIVSKPALSESEYIEIDPIGTLEASNTDGLRSLLRTMKIPNMKEKTMRYPGHIEYMAVLLESGFFDKESLEVGDVTVRPIDVTAKLLFPKWRLEPGEPDITAMLVRVRGEEEGKALEYVYHLFDHADEEGVVSSMARTTGYTCTAAVHLVLDGRFERPGICPPEYIGAVEGNLERVLAYLEERNVHYRCERMET